MKTIKKIFPVVASLLIAFLIIAISFFIKKTQVQAQASGGTLPFGGEIEDVEYCCDGSILLAVGPPSVGFYDYRPGSSMLYQYYQVFSAGPEVLGTAVPGGYCDLVDAECFTGISANTIQIIGTSSQ